MFNAAQLPPLGRVIDYEVPLKQHADAAHGDIDILCTQPHACLCVEAKKPGRGVGLESGLAGVRLHVLGVHPKGGVPDQFRLGLTVVPHPRYPHLC